MASVAEGFTAQQSPPAVQWLQVLGHLGLSRETSALWLNSHSSHSMAIETPVESVEGEILKTDSTRPSVPPGHPRVANRDNLRRGVPIGTIDVEYYLYTDSNTQGWGAHLQD